MISKLTFSFVVLNVHEISPLHMVAAMQDATCHAGVIEANSFFLESLFFSFSWKTTQM